MTTHRLSPPADHQWLDERWARLHLPLPLGHDLVRRWSAPGRHYHDTSHLTHGLTVLDDLGSDRLVEVAWWFHDAVHSNTTPRDEQQSASLARETLADHLSPQQVDEVARLVLLTIDHSPDDGDARGALLCDTDLHALTLPDEQYHDQVVGLRAERPDLDEMAWQAGRIARLQSLLARRRLFHTAAAHHGWEAAARANLRRELDDLLSPSPPATGLTPDEAP